MVYWKEQMDKFLTNAYCVFFLIPDYFDFIQILKKNFFEKFTQICIAIHVTKLY